MKSALLLLAIFAGGAVGCVDNDLSLSILQMEAITAATTCEPVSTVGLGRSRGLLDASLVSQQGYLGFPLVRNNEETRMPTADSPELNSIQLTGANVTLKFDDPAVAKLVPAGDQKFFWGSAAGRLDPANSAPLEIEVVPAKIITMDLPSVTSKLGDGLISLVAEIRPVGMQTSDRIIGGPVDYPIDICFGCLDKPTIACPFPAGTVVPPVGCISWQDDVPGCCMDATGATLCGAAAPVATATP